MTGRRYRPCLVLAAATALLAACGATPPQPAGAEAPHANATREPAELRADGITVRASIAPTATLSEAMARHYGIERSDRTTLLLVGVRSGPEMDETSLPARVTATARDLRGVRRSIDMREVRDRGFIDYVGIVRVAPPDTLGFEIQAEAVDGGRAEPMVLRFSRDLLPAAAR